PGGARSGSRWSCHVTVCRVDAVELDQHAREQLAGCKVPHLVHFVDALPYVGIGKVAWEKLQSWAAAVADADADRSANR
ncbi:MAG: hypothetical protein M3519_03650, partial [Actinomycetota bacterium]|nr:hypothetical protein [Actinomycetota bacterium]